MARKQDPLQVIPGVGPSLARDLRDLGYDRVEGLKGEVPEEMYARLAHLRGERQDPCVLYVFRCAVYFASTPRPDPELLKWWAWKDRDLPWAGSVDGPSSAGGRGRASPPPPRRAGGPHPDAGSPAGGGGG